MGLSTHRSVVVALLALALVTGPAAGTGGVTVGATDSSSGESLTPPGSVMAARDLNQTDLGALRFELDAERVGNESTVDVLIESGGQSATIAGVAADSESDGVYTYTVASNRLPDFPAAKATVTVYRGSGENRTDYLTEQGVDLRHLDIARDSAEFEGGQLTLTATNDTAGLAGSSFDLLATADGDDRRATLSATLENGTVRVDRNDAFTGLLVPPANVTLAAAGGGPSVTGDTSVALGSAAPDPTVIVSAGGVTVESPLLVAGTTYGVHVATSGPAGEFATTAPARETDGVYTLSIENEYIAGVDSVEISVSTDGGSVLRYRTEVGTPAVGTLGSNQRSVTLSDGTFADSDVEFVLLSIGDRVRVVTEATANDTTVSLGGLPAGMGLARNGSYRLVVAFADAPSKTVAVDGDAKSAGLVSLSAAADKKTDAGTPAEMNGSTGNASAGLFDRVPGGQFTLGLVGGLLILLVGGGGYVVGQSLVGGSGGGGAAAGRQTRDVRVRIADGYADERLTDEVYLTARPANQSATSDVNRTGGGREDSVEGGVVTWTLDAEPYEFTASYNGTTVTETADMLEDDLVLRFRPVSKSVTVTDETGEPVSDARVTATFDGETVTEPTDANGRASLTLPVTASAVEVTAEHDRYEPDTKRVSDPNDIPSQLRVVGKTGTLRVETAIDGQPADAVEVSLDTDDEWLRTRLRESSPTDEGDDAVGLPAGEYTLVGSVDAAPFEDDRARVTVRENKTTAVTLDVPFEYELSADHRESLASLRSDADDLVPGGRLDSAIHGYYASVARSLADAVERVPDSGVRFAETGVDPEPVVDAMLDAGNGCVEAVDNAMNTKHNVDLFSACADMREATVEWRAGYDLDDCFALIDEDRVGQRAELKSRLSEAGSTVEDHRGDVNVVSPASDVVEELEAYERDTRESDEVRNAAFVFAVAGFAAAVTELFDHPRLLDRLNRTMY
ncbi:carboxypeptidase-like regulatory domain-containing protein [Halobaculum gomorrense]|uniref:Carboxypeptidase regulatory-like domain-containing protein n=1 Tax=Halobaculum gomorrense TaxID=43928 RepID=A0A1M5NU49_9EURY|nr:carboxypeptidase-like regulatory domain-containing protein [Halobaculum gomorrense]SHG93086.1 Carboxypeptidase regulatory-like domain-containing protein [Halobaculum gomorrense]